MTLRVLLVDDHNIMRQGLRALLENHPEFEVVGEAENGRAAVALTRKVFPDVVIMDVSMPDLNGMDAARLILEEFPKAKIIALSMHSDKRFVEGMLKAGASGYLLKNCIAKELLTAIKISSAGDIFLSPKIAGTVVNGFLRNASDNSISGLDLLTVREREILQLLAEGKTSRQVANQLHVSGKTVDAHRRNIMEKLDIHSIAELTKFAIREGLTLL